MHPEELHVALEPKNTTGCCTIQRNALHECETPEELHLYIRRLERTLRKYAHELQETKMALQDALKLLAQQKADIQNYLRYELKSEQRVAVGTVSETGEQWIASAKSNE